MYDIYYDVVDNESCERRIQYDDYSRADARCKGEPCVVCAAAKERAASQAAIKSKASCDAWLAGMRAREARILQIRGDMRWSRSDYPTDRDVLERIDMR